MTWPGELANRERGDRAQTSAGGASPDPAFNDPWATSPRPPGSVEAARAVDARRAAHSSGAAGSWARCRQGGHFLRRDGGARTSQLSSGSGDSSPLEKRTGSSSVTVRAARNLFSEGDSE